MNILLTIAQKQSIRESLRAALPESDLMLFESSLGDALRRLIAVTADAIILDDGVEDCAAALERLREAAPATPVIVLSTHGDAEARANLTLSGAYACVAKPFSCEALVSAVNDAVQRSRSRSVSSVARGAEPSQSQAASAQYQMALRWLGRASSHIKDPVQLSRSLVDAATDIFDAVRSAVLLEDHGRVRIVAGHGIPETVVQAVQFDFVSGLMRWFEERACLIDRETNRDAVEAIKELQVLGARVGVPLFCAGRVIGAIVIGDKASGLDYGQEEHELLTSVARSASIAFENARLYQDVSLQQRRLDGVLSSISAGVVTIRSDKTVALMNRSAERILQLRASDVVGQSVQKLGSGFADVVLRTLAERKPLLRQEIKDPAIRATLGLSATPVADEGVVVVFSKLPEQKASSEDIAYSPFWEYLAARVAQEIKNPMVAVNTFAQLLPRKYDSEEFRVAFGEVVQKEVARINSVVETLFGFARRPRLVLQPADVNETVSNALRSFEEELQARSIELETHWEPDLPNAVLDPVYFSQALHNVVQNSIEAMPGGGTLRVSTKREGGLCQVLVADSGPGVPEQDEPLIFMPFFSTKEQGMGLGLTTANRIMKQHSGDLKLVTNKEGSAFAFSLPQAK